MLNLIKLVIPVLLFVQISVIKLDLISLITIITELFILFYASFAVLSSVLKKNIMAVGLVLFYGIFMLISGLMENYVNIEQITLMTVKIFLVFNSIFLIQVLIGRKGLIGITGSIPFPRLRMFIILFMKISDYLSRSHTGILNQLKTRLGFNWSDKMLFARYYVQNIIHTELYSFHNYQAALYTRLLSGFPELYPEKEKLNSSTVALLILTTAGTIILFII